jgi:putative hydrolase of the HAD superfamily
MDRIRAVFLDAGGTLIYLDRRFIIEQLGGHGIRVEEPAFVAADRIATAHAVRLMREGIASDDATRWRAWGETLLRALGCGAGAALEMSRAIRRRHEEGTLWTWVEPGTAEALHELRGRGYTLVVVSNADGRVAEFLAHAGLGNCFDHIVDSTIVGIEKPDPGIFRIACERAGVEPHQAVHVGDIFEIDVVGARAAGVRPILFDPHATGGYADCDRIAAIGELCDLLPGARHLRRAAGA